MSEPKLVWRGTISIQEAYAELRADPSATFWLAFVRATGKDAGSIKVVSRAAYGRKKQLFGDQAQSPNQGVKAVGSFSDKGTLPMTDTTTGEYLTPLISHIIGYNLLKVIH